MRKVTSDSVGFDFLDVCRGRRLRRPAGQIPLRYPEPGRLRGSAPLPHLRVLCVVAIGVCWIPVVQAAPSARLRSQVHHQDNPGAAEELPHPHHRELDVEERRGRRRRPDGGRGRLRVELLCLEPNKSQTWDESASFGLRFLSREKRVSGSVPVLLPALSPPLNLDFGLSRLSFTTHRRLRPRVVGPASTVAEPGEPWLLNKDRIVLLYQRFKT